MQVDILFINCRRDLQVKQKSKYRFCEGIVLVYS